MYFDDTRGVPRVHREGMERGWAVTAHGRAAGAEWIGVVDLANSGTDLSYETPDRYLTAEAACMAAYVLGRKALAEATRNGDCRIYAAILKVPLERGIRLRSWAQQALKTKKLPKCDPAEAVFVKQLAEEPDYLEALEFHLASLTQRRQSDVHCGSPRPVNSQV
jgi:hypothetical protein